MSNLTPSPIPFSKAKDALREAQEGADTAFIKPKKMKARYVTPDKFVPSTPSIFQTPTAQAPFRREGEALFGRLVRAGELGEMKLEAFQAIYSAYRSGVSSAQIEPGLFAAIDYSQPSNNNRFYLLDLTAGSEKVVGAIKVAHGEGSGIEKADDDIDPTITKRVSNTNDSHASPQGLMRFLPPAYSSEYGIYYPLQGLEPGCNDLSLDRHIWVHLAKSGYVPSKDTDDFVTKCTWGCPSLNVADANDLGLPIGKKTSLPNAKKADLLGSRGLFIYFPSSTLETLAGQ